MKNNNINKLKAERAREKKASFGSDIALGEFSDDAPKHEYLLDASVLSEDKKTDMLSVGVVASGEKRSGTFIQMDHSVIHSTSKQDGIEVLGTGEALKKHGWLSDYWWKAVDSGADKYTAQAELKHTEGYFIRAKKGIKTIFPVQACL